MGVCKLVRKQNNNENKSFRKPRRLFEGRIILSYEGNNIPVFADGAKELKAQAHLFEPGNGLAHVSLFG